MIGEAIAYILGIIVFVSLWLSSRRWSGSKRKVACLQAVALLAWGAGGLVDAWSGTDTVRWLAALLSVGFILLLLLSFQMRLRHLKPHVPRWRNWLDMLILAVLGATSAFGPPDDLTGVEPLMMHLPPNLFAMLSVLAAGFAERKVFDKAPSLPFYGWILFLLADAIAFVLPAWLWFLLLLPAIAMITAGLRGRDERLYDGLMLRANVYNHAEFDRVDRALVGTFAFVYGHLLILAHQLQAAELLPPMLLALLLLVARWFATGYVMRRSARRLYQRSRNLELQFDAYTQEIRAKNEELSRLLALKQGYERLLMKSNQQNMQDVSYENIHRMIEEIVDEWYTTIPRLSFLRVSLQSAEGTVYYEVCRGDSAVLADGKGNVRVRVVADEERDTPLSPRYVAVEAVSPGWGGGKEADSFYHLLAVHVRGLLQRCLQHQQAMELRLVAQEMELASKIQFSLIPREQLNIPGVRAKAVYIPAAYVGGDYVDFVTLDERHTCFLVADISGHGIPASMLTTGLRSAFRAVVQTCVSPDEILSRLNRLLYDDLSQTRSFVTLFVAVYDRQNRTLWTSRAGHPQPFYLSAARHMMLPCGVGPGLGLTRQAVYPLDRFEVDEDFLLLIYTDGLLQLRKDEGAAGAISWLNRFHRAVVGVRDADPIGAIEECIWEVKQAVQQEDDISVLILDVTAR